MNEKLLLQYKMQNYRVISIKHVDAEDNSQKKKIPLS